MKTVTGAKRKILHLVAEGYTTSEIATILQITKPSVMSHRRSLLVKFDASNSAELIRKAMESGGLKRWQDKEGPAPLAYQMRKA